MKDGKLTEADIQASILEWLKFKGVYAWRNNTVGVYDPTKGRHRTRGRHDINGVSDILGILPDGTFLAIEVKGPKGRLSKDQKNFLKNIGHCGGVAFMARDLEAVKTNLSHRL